MRPATQNGHLSNRASDRPARILEVQLEWDTLPPNGNIRGTVPMMVRAAMMTPGLNLGFSLATDNGVPGRFVGAENMCGTCRPGGL
jgi:hypothetical protein